MNLHGNSLTDELRITEFVHIWKHRDSLAIMPPEEWETVISIIQKLLPEYAVRDFTNEPISMKGGSKKVKISELFSVR